jgi:hypothetical protein
VPLAAGHGVHAVRGRSWSERSPERILGDEPVFVTGFGDVVGLDRNGRAGTIGPEFQLK